MDIPQRLALCCACTVSLFFAGCAAHYPYQPYPYQQYPGGYYGQPNYMGPSMGVPPNGTQLNAPTPLEQPGTTNGGSSSGGGDAPMWDPDSTNNFKELNGTGGSGSSGGTNNNVPFYDDPSSGDLGAPPGGSTKKPDMYDNEKSTFESDQNPFGLNESPTVETPGVRNVAFEEDAKTAATPPKLELASNESFAEDPRTSTPETVAAPAPVELTNAEFEQPVERTNEPDELKLPYDPNEMPNPFDHDPNGYRSLRGLVSYDQQLEAWSIIYDDKPARDDRYGGVFTLADHSDLAVLNENDVVYVEGYVSDTLRDDFGKPLYIVEHINKLRPRSQQ
jgi:hypothetical protein